MPSPDNPAVSTEPDTLAAVETETAPLQLLHLDERLAVVNKPAGLMVHDSKLARGEDDFLADRLLAACCWPSTAIPPARWARR
ncbi:hypothetical protein G6F22_017358 [Rhizopus arrhizus]|nr:hypothetical protein G6F22_017358 [Rhizopus arrhizus]